MLKPSLYSSVMLILFSCVACSMQAFAPSLRLARRAVRPVQPFKPTLSVLAEMRTDKLLTNTLNLFDPSSQLAMRAASTDILMHKPYVRVAALFHNIAIFRGAKCDIPLHSAHYLKQLGFTSRVTEPVKMQQFLQAYLQRTCTEEEKRYWLSEHPDAILLARALSVAQESRSGFKINLEVLREPVYQELVQGLRERA